MIKTKLIFLFCLAFPFFLMAQESKKLKEVGVTFTDLSFNSLGVTFRTGTERSLWRFNSALFNGNNEALTNSSSNSDNSSTERKRILNLGFGVGKEYRKKLDKRLEFRYGLDLNFGLYYQTELDNEKRVTAKETTYMPGFNLVLGFNYPIWKNLIFGMEMLPKFYYSINTQKQYYYAPTGNFITTDEDSEATLKKEKFNYNLSNNTFVFSVIYRF